MKNFPKLLYSTSALLLTLLMLSSCKNDKLIKRGDTLPTAYRKSMGLFQSGDYTEAAEAFETVIEIGRGTDYGQEAQFYLADSYFQSKRYLLAASEFERYVALFPRADKRQTAQYQEALSYYRLSPRYRLDQKHARNAIEKFRLYQSRYPDSDKVQEADQHIIDLRDKLAKKLYHAGDLYMRTDSYEAAAIYYDLTIDKYPESIWAQRALVSKINTYNTYAKRSVRNKQQERYQKALTAYEKFLQLFPKGEYRSQADDYVNDTRSALADLGVNTSTSSENSTASAENTSD